MVMKSKGQAATLLMVLIVGAVVPACRANTTTKVNYKKALDWVKDAGEATKARKKLYDELQRNQTLTQQPTAPPPDASNHMKSLSIGMLKLREAFLVQGGIVKTSAAQRSAARALLAQEEVSNLKTAADQLATLIAELGDRRDDLAKQIKSSTHPMQSVIRPPDLSTLDGMDPDWGNLSTALVAARDKQEAAEKEKEKKTETPKEPPIAPPSGSPPTSSARDGLPDWAIGSFTRDSLLLEVSNDKLVLKSDHNGMPCEFRFFSMAVIGPDVQLEVLAATGESPIRIRLERREPESIYVSNLYYTPCVIKPDGLEFTRAKLVPYVPKAPQSVGPSSTEREVSTNFTCSLLEGRWNEGKFRLRIARTESAGQFKVVFSKVDDGSSNDAVWSCDRQNELKKPSAPNTLHLKGNKIQVTPPLRPYPETFPRRTPKTGH